MQFLVESCSCSECYFEWLAQMQAAKICMHAGDFNNQFAILKQPVSDCTLSECTCSLRNGYDDCLDAQELKHLTETELGNLWKACNSVSNHYAAVCGVLCRL